LNQRYEEWVSNYKIGPVLIVDTENLNVVTRKNDLDSVADLVYSTLEKQDISTQHTAQVIHFTPQIQS